MQKTLGALSLDVYIGSRDSTFSRCVAYIDSGITVEYRRMERTVRAYTSVMKNFVIIRPTRAAIFRAINNFAAQSDHQIFTISLRTYIYHHLFKNLSRHLRI